MVSVRFSDTSVGPVTADNVTNSNSITTSYIMVKQTEEQQTVVKPIDIVHVHVWLLLHLIRPLRHPLSAASAGYTVAYCYCYLFISCPGQLFSNRWESLGVGLYQRSSLKEKKEEEIRRVFIMLIKKTENSASFLSRRWKKSEIINLACVVNSAGAGFRPSRLRVTDPELKL